MKLFMGFTVTGALLSGITQHVHVWAQTDPGAIWEVVQLGGTGGLIACLLGSVWALWKDREKMLSMIHAEREAHRAEIAGLNKKHSQEVNEVTERLLKEMKEQIQSLKVKADNTFVTHEQYDKNHH